MHLKCVAIASRRNPTLWETTITSVQRAVEESMKQASINLQSYPLEGSCSLDGSRFEEIAIQILSFYSTQINWRKMVSLPNDNGRTLAHLAVTLGYNRLLERLISWEIDLSVGDSTGATALYFAYLYDRSDCVTLILRNGVSHQVCDTPDRRPSAINWPAANEELIDGVLYKSSDLASEHASGIKESGRSPRAKDVLVQEWLKENIRFKLGQAELDYGVNSLEVANLDDLNARSPAPQTGAPLIALCPIEPPPRRAPGSIQEEIATLQDCQINPRYILSNEPLANLLSQL